MMENLLTTTVNPKELVKGSLSAILEDKAGDLWIASDYGNNIGDTLGGLWHSNTSVTNATEKIFTKICNREVFLCLKIKIIIFGLAPGVWAYIDTIEKHWLNFLNRKNRRQPIANEGCQPFVLLFLFSSSFQKVGNP